MTIEASSDVDRSPAKISELVELAQRESQAGRAAAAAAVMRFIEMVESGGVAAALPLPDIGAAVAPERLAPPERAGVHIAVGEACSLFQWTAQAEHEYRAALAIEPNAVRAHVGIAAARLPGPDYVDRLERFHRLLVPRTYLEIGVAEGRTLSLAQPPTVAVGVDPSPSIAFRIAAETHLFPEESDHFFGRAWLGSVVHEPVAMAFIDGLHQFEQALRDFINIERCCTPGAVVLFHDTVPLDEVTQRRARETDFWTGDVWKAIVCLRDYRPDLTIFTIATRPTGLTVISGLDPTSRRLDEAYAEAVARYIDEPYASIDGHLAGALNLVPNRWEDVAQRLRRVQIESAHMG